MKRALTIFLAAVLCVQFILPAFAEDITTVVSAPSVTEAPKPAVDKVRNLTASSTGEDGIILTWDDVLSAKGYQVYANDGTFKNYVLLNTVKSNSVRIVELDPGTSYTFKVRAFKRGENGKEIFGEMSDVISASTAPGKIKSIDTLDITTESVTLTWSAAAGATHYEVYLYDRSKRKFTLYGVIQGKTSFTVSELSENSIYTFKIRPVTVNGNQSAFGTFSKEYSEFTDTTYIPYTNAQAAKLYNTAVNGAKSLENGSVAYHKKVATAVKDCSKRSLLRTCKNLMKLFDGEMKRNYLFRNDGQSTDTMQSLLEPYNRSASLRGSDIYSYSYKKDEKGVALKIKLKSETSAFNGKTREPSRNKSVMTTVKLEKRRLLP